LTYLRMRGLSEKEAIDLICSGFLKIWKSFFKFKDKNGMEKLAKEEQEKLKSLIGW
jgi:Fe-S cluster assembly scaffold protein SufB